MTPQEIINNRERQVQAWLDAGHITSDQLAEIRAIWESNE